MQSFSSLNCPESTEKNTFQLLTKLFSIQGVLTGRPFYGTEKTLSKYLLNEGITNKGNRGVFVQISIKLQNILTLFKAVVSNCFDTRPSFMADNFSTVRGGGWFGDDSSALHLLCNYFLLLLHQFYLRSSGIRSWRMNTPALMNQKKERGLDKRNKRAIPS